MSDDVPRLPWTDEQWTTVQRIVQDAAGRARVASAFLPLVGPLLPGQTTVPALTMDSDTLETDDETTFPLTTIACNVELTTQQAEDPELAVARLKLARAAERIGGIEDQLVFNHAHGANARAEVPDPWSVSGHPRIGLLNAALSQKPIGRIKEGDVDSQQLVKAIAAGIEGLESRRHYGPFACVLGRDLFLAANSPADSMVFPSDRILPFLEGGPLRRSSVLPADRGLIVALAGSPVDLVVASDVHVKFLQITLEPRYILRVSERFVLRIKQPEAICRLEADPPRVTGTNGGSDAETPTSES